MFLRIDPEHLVWGYPWSKDDPGIRIIEKSCQSRWIDLGGLKGQLKSSPDGRLVLNHPAGATILDPKDWSQTDLARCDKRTPNSHWNLSFLSSLIDVEGCRYAHLEIDRSALKLSDPGYTEPTDATLLPGRNEVAINIVREDHLAIFDFEAKRTEIVNLPRKYSGSAYGQIVNNELWMTNYDVLCCMDVVTRSIRSSPVLQPEISDPKYGNMRAFVGVPLHVEQLQGWLVPRPYSADILLVSSDDLDIRGHIETDGRPWDIGLFDDGTLLILDHALQGNPFDTLRTSHISALTST